jgi:MFS family permease
MSDSPHRPYLLLVVLLAVLGPLQFGFHLAELNAPEEVLTCKKRSIFDGDASSSSSSLNPHDTFGSLPSCIPMSSSVFAVVSSIYTLGGLVGALSGGPVSSALGRVPTMRITSVFAIVGSILEAFAPHAAMLATGRVLTGVAAGASTVVVPLYISEVAPPQSRGLYGFMTQISINIGIVITQGIGYFLSHDSSWRWILVAGLGIAVLHAIGLSIVAESPAWLASKGRKDEAKVTLRRLRGDHANLNIEYAALGITSRVAHEETAFLGGEHAVESQNYGGALSAASTAPPSVKSNSSRIQHHKETLTVFQVVRDSFYRPAIIATVGVLVAQQLCGINSIIMYSVRLLNGIVSMNSALLTVMISCANLFATIACAPLPDRLGRKACLLLSILGQGTSAFILAFGIRYDIKLLSAVFVFAFVVAFAVGLGPVPFMLASEMVGQEAVGATQSWALASNYVATFLVSLCFPLINDGLNAKLDRPGSVYFIFTALALLSGLFVWKRVPETKGKRDVDEVWGRTRRED